MILARSLEEGDGSAVRGMIVGLNSICLDFGRGDFWGVGGFVVLEVGGGVGW